MLLGIILLISSILTFGLWTLVKVGSDADDKAEEMLKEKKYI